VLLQNLDDLLFSEPALTHLSVSPMGTDSTQKRGHLRGAGHGYSPDRKGALILALEKYVAIDMGLALSAYDSVLVD
jgi:hypothetical protein